MYQEASACAWDDPTPAPREGQARASAPLVEGDLPQGSNTLQDSTSSPCARAANGNIQRIPEQQITLAGTDASEIAALDDQQNVPSALSQPVEIITLDSPAVAVAASDDDSWTDNTGTAHTGRSNHDVSGDGCPSQQSRPPSNPTPACWSRNVPQAGTPTAALGALAGADSEHDCSSAGMEVIEQPHADLSLSSFDAHWTSLSQMEDVADPVYPAVIKMHGQITGLVGLGKLLQHSLPGHFHTLVLQGKYQEGLISCRRRLDCSCLKMQLMSPTSSALTSQWKIAQADMSMWSR